MSGARERKEERVEERFAGWAFFFFSPSSQQNVSGASHSGFIISKSKHLTKVGTFSETGQVREHSKEQS